MIQDPWFYAVAVPAVLLMGLGKSGFASGLGAFATPLMALAIPVPQAAAIMLPLLLVMDLVGLRALFMERDRGLIRLLLPAGLTGTLCGWILFGMLAPRTVAAIVGALTLLFLLQRLFFPARADVPPPRRWLGILAGIASGFTSFVAHAGSPPIAAYVLPRRLAPMTYTATLATFFAAINFSKWIPYAFLGLIDLRNMTTAIALLPLAPVGVWIGIRMARRMHPKVFYALVYTGMTLTAVKLLYDGFGH